MLLVLARELDGPEESRLTVDTFDGFQNSDLDTPQQLENWLLSSVGKFEMHQPNWLSTLRCVNQGIVFPAVFHMKKLFTDKFAYKDSKGSWKVRISILSKDVVEIQHRKGEKSQLTGPQDNFSFTWNMTFRLDLTYGDLDVSVSILDYIFDKEMNNNIKAELLAAMQPFLSGSAPYIAIWRKPIRKLPVARDFGRLCGRLSIFNHLGRPIHTRDPDLSGSALVRKCLLTLADCFNPELIPAIEDSLNSRFTEDGEMMEQLTKVLHTDKVVPDDSHLAAVLKCINTTVVFPAVDFLHTRVYDKLRYRDVRGTWATHVTLGPAIRSQLSNSSSSVLIPGSSPSLNSTTNNGSSEQNHSPETQNVNEAPDSPSSSAEPLASPSSVNTEGPAKSAEIPRYRYVSILHRKMEQAHSVEPKDQFQFEWIVEFILNREMMIKDVHMGVVDFSFGPQTSDETRAHVLSCLKPFLRPSTFQTQATAVPAHDILDIAIKKIEELELLSKTLASGYHPNMPHSVDLKSLLKTLKASIPNTEVRLPSGESMKATTEATTTKVSPGSSKRLSLPSALLSASGSESPPGSASSSDMQKLRQHQHQLSNPNTNPNNRPSLPSIPERSSSPNTKERKRASERAKHSPLDINATTVNTVKSPRAKKSEGKSDVTIAPLPPALEIALLSESANAVPPPNSPLPPDPQSTPRTSTSRSLPSSPALHAASPILGSGSSPRKQTSLN